MNMSSYFTVDDRSEHVQTTSFHSLPTSPRIMDALPRDAPASDGQPFDIVGRKLKELGAVPLEEFLSNRPSSIPPRLHFSKFLYYDTKMAYDMGTEDSSCVSVMSVEDRSPSPSSNAPAPLSERNMNGDTRSSPALLRDNAISRLHQVCIHAFGSADLLKYEFLEENGQKSKQCVLTIARPDGQVRSYKSEAVFLRRADAKARVATIATQMGGLKFIIDGDSGGLEAGKSLSPPSSNGVEVTGTGGSIESEGLIEKLLLEWRAGKVHPEWIFYSDPRVVGHYGAAVRIQLTKHSLRVYSCDSIFNSESDAKAACVQRALDEGILDYIKFGNGQKEPARPSLEDKEPELFDQQRRPPKRKTRPISLQSYYESLPRPFPEPFGNKGAVEINAPSYINTLLQSARGGRLKSAFYWIMDKTTGLLGCLLRLERGREAKSYFADHLFQKRSDAKAAACFLALSQGIGDYIRSVKVSLDTNFTPEMRKLASEKFIFALNTECNKICQGNRLNFTYTEDLDAFGASLEINISSSPGLSDTRRWTVAAEYRSKNDAKLAVCYQAVSQGAIEMLRFRGAPPPPGHISYWDTVQDGGATSRAAKRKSTESDAGLESCNQQKKRRRDEEKLEPNVLGSIANEKSEGVVQRSSGGSSNVPKQLASKRPLHPRLQESDSNIPRDGVAPRVAPPVEDLASPGNRTPRHLVSSPPQPGGHGGCLSPQNSYYPSPAVPSPHHPASPHRFTSTSPPVYHQPALSSPIAFTTYHTYPTMPEPFMAHPPMYHPHMIPSYTPPAFSPYQAMPSPYHPPYMYPPLSPLYVPPTLDIWPMEGRDYRQDIYHHHSPPVPPQPMWVTPPSTPSRPQKIKRIDRNSALSPLKVAETLTTLEHLPKESKREQAKQETDEGNGALEPGELVEGEEVDITDRHQVLERRASMP